MGIFSRYEKEKSNDSFEEINKKAINEKEKEQKRHCELIKNLPKTKKMIGYKAVDNEYQAFYGNHQKYEIGKEYSISDELIPCQRGFHFCKNLDDVLELFPPVKGGHYLKVEGEIPVDYYFDEGSDIPHPSFRSCAHLLYLEQYDCYLKNGKWNPPSYNSCELHREPELKDFFNDELEHKYVTHKIKILEEVPFSNFSDQALNELISSENEYYNIISYEQYQLNLEKKIIEYSEGMFSEAFLRHWIYKVYLKAHSSYPSFYLDCFRTFKEKFDAIKDENISQDIKVLFMLGL